MNYSNYAAKTQNESGAATMVSAEEKAKVKRKKGRK